MQKFKEVMRFILCPYCLHIFDKWSVGLRFHDEVCPCCHKIIWLTYAFKNEFEAIERREKIEKKRAGKAVKGDDLDG